MPGKVASNRRQEEKNILTHHTCPDCHQKVRQNEIMAVEVQDLRPGGGKRHIEMHHAPAACAKNKQIAQEQVIN